MHLEVKGLPNLVASCFDLSNNLLQLTCALWTKQDDYGSSYRYLCKSLIGCIPSVFGSYKGIEYLDISCNALEGPIPIIISSNNNLLRRIPKSSETHKMLISPLTLKRSSKKWVYLHDEEVSMVWVWFKGWILVGYRHSRHRPRHGLSPWVVHFHLKSNNVLLGEYMTTYLIDFGIDTICFTNSCLPFISHMHSKDLMV